jgi:hypothetical protein
VVLLPELYKVLLIKITQAGKLDAIFEGSAHGRMPEHGRSRWKLDPVMSSAIAYGLALSNDEALRRRNGTVYQFKQSLIGWKEQEQAAGRPHRGSPAAILHAISKQMPSGKRAEYQLPCVLSVATA